MGDPVIDDINSRLDYLERTSPNRRLPSGLTQFLRTDLNNDGRSDDSSVRYPASKV